MNIENLYYDEIQTEFSELKNLKKGSEERKATVAEITQLTDRVIKLKEIEIERAKVDIESDKVTLDALKSQDEATDRKVKNWIAVGTTVAGAAITLTTFLWAYVYEERGTICSKPGNKALDKALNFFYTKK